MDLLAFAIRHAIAPAWARWERSPYLRHYRRLLQTQFDSPERIRQRQWDRVTALLQHAYATTPFWRERLDEMGTTPDQIRSWDDFYQLPLLTKADLRARNKDLFSALYDSSQDSLRPSSYLDGCIQDVRGVSGGV